ncbi:MAG: putative ABC transporter permease [Coriobacteriales bacterium]|nr:putative ABC transporter permease [Coriobacteriales bacterium]
MVPFEGVIDAAAAHVQAIVDRFQETARRRSKDYTYGFRTARDLAQLAGSGATLWLMYKRKSATVPASVATAAVTAGLTVATYAFDKTPQPLPAGPADDDATGAQDADPQPTLIRDKVVNGIADVLPSVIGALTVAFSPGAKETLTQPMDLLPRDSSIPFTVPEHIRNATSLYAVYTIVGHWLEMAFCQLIRLGVVGGDYDRSNTMLWDWWLHPFPAEGIAGVLIAGGLSPLCDVLLKRFGGRIVPAVAVSFLVNQVVCTSIDYLTGMVANRNYELWDYRNMPFNFQGQICLQNSLVYTTAATLVAWLAYPARNRWLMRLPADITNTMYSALAPAYTFLCLTYFV